MMKLLVAAAMAFLLGACGITDPCGRRQAGEPVTERVSIDQGVWGRVLFLEGNFMPVANGCSSGRVYPVSRMVYIFEPVTRQELVAVGGESTLYAEVPALAVDSVRSDADGFYQLDLPPGLYSILVREDSAYFVNGYSDTEVGLTAQPVRVETGRTVQRSIEIDYKAAY